MSNRIDAHLALWIIVRVWRAMLSRDAIVVLNDSQGLQGVGIKLNRQGLLGERDKSFAYFTNVHIGVSPRLKSAKRRGNALEKRAARIGGKFSIAYFACLSGFEIGGTLQKSVGIRDIACVKCKAVEHRQSIKPVIKAPLSYFKLRRTIAQEYARQPGRHFSLHRQTITRNLLSLGGEATSELTEHKGISLLRGRFLANP
jgi:hypothetical protein